MEAAPPETPAPSRSRTARSANSSSQGSSQTYGYHNTFHTHAQIIPDTPPSYACATSTQTLDRLHAIASTERAAYLQDEYPPQYACTVEIGGILGMKQELSSPFQVAGTREWNDVYVLLRGTQLCIYRIKSPHFLFKSRSPGPGRLIKSFSLQHAEVGVASDFKKTPLTPKSPFAHLVPTGSRQKLYETDPHLFETVREHVLRLRVETEQFLLCASSQEQMLDWVEKLCAGVDISPPLEDRSEPRYRSLPRRSRRQRVLDGSRISGNLENLPNVEGGRRIIAEQERIIRQLYPNLAADSEAMAAHAEQPHDSNVHHSTDPEVEDFDPEDVRFPSRRPGSSGERPSSSATSTSSDPKSAPPHQYTASQALRYRRRCAPVLLAHSSRVSDTVFSNGRRMRINVKEHILVDYTSHPPRYDVHNFPKAPKRLPTIAERRTTSTKAVSTTANPERPTSPIRGDSDDSITFGYDLSSSASVQTGLHSDSDDIRSAPSSEPPSPTGMTGVKGDATRQMGPLVKRRASEEGREGGLNAVALGVGLLI
ncbi:hypothetical protein K505DRAFT_236415 [Melanomma pulvis-pyrius CBS 109.77]|uniref:PH domain-containing protein n=1 Tax=Melanomma pulvis-pyrius CBS 109.77 TaxID=1314802 RepID=A0A6A6XKH6_9PLEO|nr:hypothetical protein K505DRAFT_236415 [Melanomma pulvis-pyrius CBS 109.77]